MSLGVRTDTHPSSSSPLFSLHTRSYSSPRPTFVFASSLNVWLSVQVRVFLPNVEEEVGWRHGRVWRTIFSLCLGRAEMWRKTMLLVLQMQIRSDFEGLCVSWDRWQDLCALLESQHVFPGFLSTSQFSDRLAENKNANLNRSCVSFRCKPLSFAFQFEALVIRWDFMLMFGWSLSGPSLHLWTAFNAD